MAYNPPNQNGQALSASSAPVVLASDQSTVKTKLATDIAATTGTITTATSAVTATNLSGIGSVTVSIYGTYAGVNATFEVYDGVNWIGIAAQSVNLATSNVVLTTGALTANSTNAWNVSPLLGAQQFRVRATAYTSGTATVIIQPSAQFTQYLNSVIVSSGTIAAVNALTPGTAAGNLGKAEDAVHATGDTGVAVLGVRNDAAAVGTSATGDYGYMRLDQYNQLVMVPGVSGTDTITRVASTATSTQLLAANTSRKGAYFYNESTSILYLAFAATASVTAYTVQIAPNGYYELPTPVRQGIITGIWSAANGAVQVTESI